jgi:hypothetical protein
MYKADSGPIIWSLMQTYLPAQCMMQATPTRTVSTPCISAGLSTTLLLSLRATL